MRNALLIVLLAVPIGGLALSEPAKSEPPEKDAVDSEQIGKLLKEMKFEPQLLSPDVWQATVSREGWKVHVMVSLADDGERIGLECKFATIPDPDIIRASAWLKLLQENERINPAHFAFDKGDKRIHLYKSFDNIGVTSARLKKEIEAFDATVRRTQNVWRSEAFSRPKRSPFCRAQPTMSQKRCRPSTAPGASFGSKPKGNRQRRIGSPQSWALSLTPIKRC